VREGFKIRLKHDMRCEDRCPQGSLINSLDLYNFACVKDAFGADHLKISGGSYN
jgi:hypothetical protein